MAIVIGGGTDSGTSAIGVGLLIVALIVWLINLMFRLSVASNLSFASSIQDAPPIPTIADSWLNATSQVAKVQPRDLRGRLGHGFRDSVASSMLDTLQEESPVEPNRKSYVSFADSGSDTAAVRPGAAAVRV